MKIRGKRLTVAQSDLLNANGYDPNMYLYVQKRVYNEGQRSKKPGQNLKHYSSKKSYQIFVNRETGEEIECEEVI